MATHAQISRYSLRSTAITETLTVALDNVSAVVGRPLLTIEARIRRGRHTGQIRTRKYSRKSNFSLEFPTFKSLQISWHLPVSGPSKHSANERSCTPARSIHARRQDKHRLIRRFRHFSNRVPETTKNNSQNNTKQFSLRCPSLPFLQSTVRSDRRPGYGVSVAGHALRIQENQIADFVLLGCQQVRFELFQDV